MMNTHKPIVFAHRGANRLAPENTLGAFKKAHALGANAVEFDVQLSSDLVPVVIHDDVLERTTNGQGFVADHSFAALKKLDAGLWFHPHFQGERVPSLAEVLEEIIPLGMMINIEIKPNRLSVTTLVEKVRLLLEQFHCPPEQVLLSSFFVK